MTSKLSPAHIIGKHYATFHDHRTGKASLLDWTVMVGIPIGLGIGGYWRKWAIISDNHGDWLAFFSIFIGFLLNLLVFVFGIVRTTKYSDNAATQNKSKSSQQLLNQVDQKSLIKEQNQLLNETFHNIAYGILIGILLIGFIVVSLVREVSPTVYSRVDFILESCFIILLAHFGLTLMLILKRTHSLWVVTGEKTEVA